MVEISLSGSGEGPGWATAPGYSTAAFFEPPLSSLPTSSPQMRHISPVSGSFDSGVEESVGRACLDSAESVARGRVEHALS
jgi:hypothetical protein